LNNDMSSILSEFLSRKITRRNFFKIAGLGFFSLYGVKSLQALKSFILPKSIRMEACSLCQLACPSCPNAQGLLKDMIGYGYLKFQDFKRFMDKNQHIRRVELSNWGEIFLNPELDEIIEYGFLKNIHLTAWNGVNLNNVSDDMLEKLVKYKFKGMACSIDGASNESYIKYRVGGNYDRVIKNVKRINYFKKKYNSKYPRLSWQFIIFGHNEHELIKARQMASDLNMKFYTKLSWDEEFSPIINADFVRKHSGLGVAYNKEFYKKNKPGYSKYCNELWDKPQINWDGKILGCCPNRKLAFEGEAFKDDFYDIMTSDKINYAREMVQGIVKVKHGIPCTLCWRYEEMKKKNLWLKRKT